MTTSPGLDLDLDLERSDLLETLAKHRDFLRYTVRDLDDARATERTTSSELCLAGLIKHVTAMEEQWARFITDGPAAIGAMDAAAFEAHANSFKMLDGESLASLLERYDDVARRTDELVASLPSLD